MRRSSLLFLLLFSTFSVSTLFGLASCGAKSKIEDIIDDVNPDRKPINPSIVGVNAFVNDSRFGSIGAQFDAVKNTVRLRYVRVLFAWNDGVQPSPGSEPNFSFYDDILDGVPAGLDVLVVMTGVPTWMRDSSNWIDGNPRKTFAELWVRKVAARYGGNGRVSSFEVWNEPNMIENSDNATLGIADSPANYVEMLGYSYSILKDRAPGKLVVSAATTAINQNYPESKNYNEGMKDAGAESFCDVWGVHYYGAQYENVARNNGVGDLLNSLSRPIWVTESGAQGVNEQLPYVERAWPYLTERIPGIQRFYYYQFTEATPPETTYGLRNLSNDLPVSDLYVFLRDR